MLLRTLWLDEDNGAVAAHYFRVACDEEGTKMVRVDRGAGEPVLAPNGDTSVASCVLFKSTISEKGAKGT